MNQIVMCLKLPLVCVCLLAGCLASAADLKIKAEPAFIGYGQATGTFPLAVTLKNDGPDAKGVLRVASGEFQMDYPIELPRGATKRLVTYPQVDYSDEVSLELSTNQGNVHGAFRQLLTSDPAAQIVLLIGDNQGDLGFLRPLGESNASRMSDSYTKPEDAPDRMSGYANICGVVLGPGAERLSDGVVRALHTYIASGGTVAFLGGGSAPALSDPRWADVAPVRPKLPKTVQSSQLISNLSETPLGGPFTLLDSQPAPGAATRIEGGNVIVARRDIALGRTVFLSFNPLESPFSRWPGRKALFEKMLRPIDSARAMGFLQDFTAASNDYDEYGYGGGYVASTPPPPMRFSSSAGGYIYSENGRRPDPFSTELPPPTKVFWILSTYFIVIIPINFIFLKRLKKGELAWFTAPLISVAFAGAFFAAAKDLYSASLSTATQGLLVASKDGGNTLFAGHSQLFFPQGGQYNLKMEGVESVGGSSPDDYGYGYGRRREQRGLSEVNPVDIGHILISRMDVGNLAFRELGYQQILPAAKWFDVEVVQPVAGGGHVLRVKNISPYKLNGVTAIVAGKTFLLPQAVPGVWVKVELPRTITPDQLQQQEERYSYSYNGRQGYRYSGLPEITAQTKEIVIQAAVYDAPVGPEIGHTVETRQAVMLAYFSGVHYGKVQL